MDMRTNGNNLFFEDNITVDGKDFPQEFNWQPQFMQSRL